MAQDRLRARWKPVLCEDEVFCWTTDMVPLWSHQIWLFGVCRCCQRGVETTSSVQQLGNALGSLPPRTGGAGGACQPGRIAHCRRGLPPPDTHQPGIGPSVNITYSRPLILHQALLVSSPHLSIPSLAYSLSFLPLCFPTPCNHAPFPVQCVSSSGCSAQSDCNHWHLGWS